MAAMAVMAAPASAALFASAPSRPALLHVARPLALEGRALPAGATPAAPTAAAAALAAGACGLAAARRRRGRGRALALRRAAKDGGKKALVKDQEGGVRVAEKEEKDLDYVPSREDLEKEELELLEATGSLKLQQKEEAYWKRRKYREQNPSQMDKWENDMEAMRMDTQRRKLWGDLRWKSAKFKRMRGKQVAMKEEEIKWNRGFPVADTEEDDQEEAAQDKRWIDMWRAAWPAQEAVDPHDPESFGFGLVGEVTGAHGIHGDVRVRADDLLCDQGFDPEEYLSYRQFSNWTEKSKRVHLKAPHRRFPRPFKILKGSRVQRRVFSLRLKGVDSVEQAMAMRGFKVYALEPPPGAEGAKAKDSEEFSGYDLYDADTTHFHTHDALELIGAKCVQLVGPLGNPVEEEVLGDFATAETPEAAEQVLADNGVRAVPFGEMTAVVPDFKIAPRFRCRQAAHNLLDITLYPEVSGGEGKFLEEYEDPDSPIGKFYREGMERQDEEFERVVYVPFVPDMIARVDADRASSTVYFTLPKGHIQATSFTCRKRFVDEKGLLAIPRGPSLKGLLPPKGKSHALRRRDGRRLPLHGTAPAPPADMKHPANMIAPFFGPGVPLPPED